MRRTEITIHEYAPLDDLAGRWQPWTETVGFVLRRITLRRMAYPEGYRHARMEDFYVAEFDIQDGCGGYHATGFWAIDARSLEPISEPQCVPVSLAEALAPHRIFTNLRLDVAKARLLSSIRMALAPSAT